MAYKRGGTPIITTSQLAHPDLCLPVRFLHLLVACTTFQENPTLVSSPHAISSPCEVDNFRLFVKDINGAPMGITDDKIADMSSRAAEFGSVRLLREIEVHNLRLSVARSATWERKDIRKLIVDVRDSSLPGRDEFPIMNLTRSLGELVAHRSAEVHPTPRSTAGDEPAPSSAGTGETKRKVA
jgi:hypothetical protein